MTYSWIICGGLGIIAGWLYSSTQYYRRKWKELKGQYTERCAELTDAKKEVDDLNVCLEEIRVRTLALLEMGHENLEASVESDNVMIVGTFPQRTQMMFVVKRFYFDPNDPSDREFAIRQAEELIEIIQNF